MYAKVVTETKKSLKGIKVFVRKEDEGCFKNIIKLYFCDKSNENWE